MDHCRRPLAVETSRLRRPGDTAEIRERTERFDQFVFADLDVDERHRHPESPAGIDDDRLEQLVDTDDHCSFNMDRRWRGLCRVRREILAKHQLDRFAQRGPVDVEGQDFAIPSDSASLRAAARIGACPETTMAPVCARDECSVPPAAARSRPPSGATGPGSSGPAGLDAPAPVSPAPWNQDRVERGLAHDRPVGGAPIDVRHRDQDVVFPVARPSCVASVTPRLIHFAESRL